MSSIFKRLERQLILQDAGVTTEDIVNLMKRNTGFNEFFEEANQFGLDNDAWIKELAELYLIYAGDRNGL